MTKWWKCDLQLATPAWRFTMPADEPYDLMTSEGRRAFAARYAETLAAKGLDVIAISDHNTGAWIDDIKAAANERGISVFPACEVTTGTGADGVHIIVIGSLGKTSHDFDLLLAGTLGFDHEHPRFRTDDSGQVPSSSGKTILQILNDLPDDYLVVAPHVFGDNGLASGVTARGDIRWKALHHERLGALDPGDCSDPTGDSFNDRFRRRELDQFPALKEIAFVSTSDAYRLEDIGRRFCWIRMEEPSLEGLRQAFLDPRARIICDWDSRLAGYEAGNPNNVKQGWIESLALGGVLGNSRSGFEIDLHPGLNVIIGGRGSGKSTVVAAIRQLYAGLATLPDSVRQEAERFADSIFQNAELKARHRVSASQERQQASWTLGAGPLTQANGNPDVQTDFRVRVVNQKELFERVSYDPHDPFAASRSFLAFVDEGLGLLRQESPLPGSWWRRLRDAGAAWTEAIREQVDFRTDMAQLPGIRAKIRQLEAQVSAFDSPDSRMRRERNDTALKERDALSDRERAVRNFLDSVGRLAAPPPLLTDEPRPSGLGPEATAAAASLETIANETRQRLVGVVEQASGDVDQWRLALDISPWGMAVQAAVADSEAYLTDLKAQGIDPETFVQLKNELARQRSLESELAGKDVAREAIDQRVVDGWLALQTLLAERRQLRTDLLTSVSVKSGKLRFELRHHRDTIGWAQVVRDRLGLRSDGFLEDVPTLANWIWGSVDDATMEARWLVWRTAMTTGEVSTLAQAAELRSTWERRLQSLDQSLRLLLAAEAPDDVVQISFLRDGGNPEVVADWQDISQGSPGQRTAAMLGFVLHHGDEPLVLDQPEDDLDTEWISKLVVTELRASRWTRQIIAITHNANIPVNGDAERVVVLENVNGSIQVRESSKEMDGQTIQIKHCGAIEVDLVRNDIQNILEGGVRAFMQRERKYNLELRAAAPQRL